MQRRLFTMLALLAPVSALAQTEPTTPPNPPRAPRPRMAEMSWAQLRPPQHARLLPGFGTPAPTPAEAGARWDAMDLAQRRRIIVATRRPRTQGAPPPN